MQLIDRPGEAVVAYRAALEISSSDRLVCALEEAEASLQRKQAELEARKLEEEERVREAAVEAERAAAVEAERAAAQQRLEAAGVQAELLKLDGNKLFKNHLFSQAEECYGKALEALTAQGVEDSFSDLVMQCRLNIAACCLKQARHEEAIKQCSLVLGIQPTNTKALYRRGSAYATLGNVNAALVDLHLAAIHAPEDSAICALISSLEPHHETAAKHGSKDETRKDPNSEPRVQPECARSESEVLIPGPAKVIKEQADSHFREARFECAISGYSKALDAFPSDPRFDSGRAVCHNNRAAAFFQLREFEKVISDTSSVLSIEPQNLKALVRRCQSYEHVGKFEQAANDANIAVKIEYANGRLSQVGMRAQGVLTRCRSMQSYHTVKLAAESDQSAAVNGPGRKLHGMNAVDLTGGALKSSESDCSQVTAMDDAGKESCVSPERHVSGVEQSARQQLRTGGAEQDTNAAGLESRKAPSTPALDLSSAQIGSNLDCQDSITATAIAQAKDKKDNGNKKFQLRLWKQAGTWYEDAISVLSNPSVAQDNPELASLRDSLHLNLALVALKEVHGIRDAGQRSQLISSAIEHSSAVLMRDNRNAKALFRRGQAYAESAALQVATTRSSAAPSDPTVEQLLLMAQEDLLAAAALSPGDAAIIGALQALEHRQAQLRGGLSAHMPKERSD